MTKVENRYELFRDAIRRKVCSTCLDQRDDGTCGLSHRTCAIEAHLPGIVEAIAGVDSNQMDEYIAAIEAQVCSACENGPGPVCALRKHGECALDTYLYLVVDAVEDVVKGAKGVLIRPHKGRGEDGQAPRNYDAGAMATAQS